MSPYETQTPPPPSIVLSVSAGHANVDNASEPAENVKAAVEAAAEHRGPPREGVTRGLLRGGLATQVQSTKGHRVERSALGKRAPYDESRDWIKECNVESVLYETEMDASTPEDHHSEGLLEECNLECVL